MKKVQNKKTELILPLLASIGVGAVTFYSMSKNNNSLAKTAQEVAPILSTMTDQSTSSSNQQSAQQDAQTLGPHGMS